MPVIFLMRTVSFFLCCAALVWPLSGVTAESPARETLAPYTALIAAAGNAESDAVRLAHLQKLAHRCAADGVTLPGLDGLIRFVERWDAPAERLDFFRQEVKRTMDFEFNLPAGSPLQPIADFYRARMLTWVTLEYSEIYPFPEKRALWLGKARSLFASAHAAFPDNRVIAMYLGQPMPPERRYEAPPGAPAWAVAQREGLERLTDVIEWWIDHRMHPNGEYGGRWGDDCEMWRDWAPILLGFEHARINWAQAYFSEQLLAQPHLATGYPDQFSDVEHSAEDIADALTPMMFLSPGNPEWAKRVNRLVDLAETRWTGHNERGFLQFKSTYFTADQVDLTSAHACDTVYHPRVLQPALHYWQRTGDARIGRLVTEWMRTWVDAAARAERGKPAGILPTAIHWPDGRVGGAGEHWWQPENYDTPLYDFPSAMALMLNTLVLTTHLTGDPAYLVPLRTMAAARLDWIRAGRPDAPAGSWLWCGANLGQLGGIIAKYRFLSGDPSLDALLQEEADVPYVRFRLQGDLPTLEGALATLAGALSVNFAAYTQEVRYTDRVFRFPMVYEPGWMLEAGAPTAGILLWGGVVARDLDLIGLLYSTVTGDPGSPLYFPLNAVRWRTPPRDIAALVTAAAPDKFSARLYHFGAAARELRGEFLRLVPGEYHYTLLQEADGVILQEGRFALTDAQREIGLTLPSRVPCRLNINPAGREK